MKNISFDVFYNYFKLLNIELRTFKKGHVLVSLQKFIKFAFFLLAFESKISTK